MTFLVKFFKWIFKAFTIIAPFAPLLWGVTVYSGIAYSVWFIIRSTSDLIASFAGTFNSWAEGWDTALADIFSTLSGNSYFSFIAYVTSLDIPLEWFRYYSGGFIRYGLTYTCGISIAVLEVCIVVLGVYFVRKRLKSITLGMGGGDSGSNNI